MNPPATDFIELKSCRHKLVCDAALAESQKRHPGQAPRDSWTLPMTPSRWPLALLIALLLPLDGARAAPGAHVHGHASLQLALDGPRLTLTLDSPLEALLGFEHSPRNAAEREAVRRLGQGLRQADSLFTLSQAAQCRLEGMDISSGALPAELLQEPQTAAGARSPLDSSRGAARPAQNDAHGDLLAEYRYACAQPEQLRSLQTGAFKSFGKLRRIEVERATGRSQGLHRLTPSQPEVSW